MVDSSREELKLLAPPAEVLAKVALLAGMFVAFTGLAVASPTATAAGGENCASFFDTIRAIGNFVILVILGVAVPNGAYGIFEWMTAGSSVDQDEKGRKRIRNTFVGIAGAALVKGAVAAMSAFVGANQPSC